jgi:two-component system chemotaxis sensor kinase CheA
MSDELSFEDELKKDFFDDVVDMLAQCEESYLKLNDPASQVLELGKIFRAVHSIKGAGASIGLGHLASFAHVVEDLLSLLRNKPDLLDNNIISILLLSGDEINRCISMEMAHDKTPWQADELKKQIQNLTIQLSGGSRQVLTKEVLQSPKFEATKEVKEHQETNDQNDHHPNNNGSGSIKVDSRHVEDLSNIAVDLMVLRKQFGTHCKIYPGDQTLKSLVTLLDKNIDLIYEKAVHLRKVPVNSLLVKSQRVIRDLSIKLNKPVDVNISGETVEVDRVIVEALADPLMHMVRNSLDHGIEDQETRKKRGKPEKGTIDLAAYQTGGKIFIKIVDDGGGINREKIINQAKKRNLISEDTTSSSLSDQDVFNFLFAPGFSTAEKVTDVSGRGVGMDVVKTNIDKLKGTISIETKEEHGTSLTISLPLTSAIVEGMLFKVANDYYILPMDCIYQVIKTCISDIVKMPNGSEVVKYRSNVYSYFKLEEIFNQENSNNDTEKDTMHVLLFNTSKQVVALRIDEVLGKTEAILRPLGDGYKDVQGFSGASLLGNGHLALVLDPLGLEVVFSNPEKNQPHLQLVG